MDAVRMGETDPWTTVEYLVPEYRRTPIRQQTLHPKVRVTAGDEPLFGQLLSAVRIREGV